METQLKQALRRSTTHKIYIFRKEEREREREKGNQELIGYFLKIGQIRPVIPEPELKCNQNTHIYIAEISENI